MKKKLFEIVKEITAIINGERNGPPKLSREQVEVIEFLMEWADFFVDKKSTQHTMTQTMFLSLSNSYYRLNNRFFKRKKWIIYDGRCFGYKQPYFPLGNMPALVIRNFWRSFVYGNNRPMTVTTVNAGDDSEPHTGTNRLVCERETKFGKEIQCQQCGEFFKPEKLCVVTQDFTEHVFCNDRISINFLNTRELFGQFYCQECRPFGAQRYCAICHTAITPQHLRTNRLGSMCPRHWRELDERGRRVEHPILENLYNLYRPIKFYGGDNPPYFGIETEIENVANTLQEQEEFCRGIEERWRDHFVFKKDGSLYHGMEFNSQPMTLEYIMAHEARIKNVLHYAQRKGTSGRKSNCGLHIHIDERSFRNERHMYNFQLFFDSQPSMSLVLSGRTIEDLLEWSEIRDIPTNIVDDAKGLIQWCREEREDDDRYYAVNYCSLQRHHTLELRLFKGTLFPNIWIGRVQIVYAVLEVTRQEDTVHFVDPLKVLNYLEEKDMQYGLSIFENAYQQVFESVKL